MSQPKNSHTPHIRKFLEREDRLEAEAKRSLSSDEWEKVGDEFREYSARQMLTAYCQERVAMVNKYQLMRILIPRKAIGL